MAEKDDDNFASEFEGDEFADEGFDLTDEHATAEPSIARANEPEPSLVEKLLAMKNVIVIIAIVVGLFVLFMMMKHNNNADNNNDMLDMNSKYASKTASISSSSAVTKPVVGMGAIPTLAPTPSQPIQPVIKAESVHQGQAKPVDAILQTNMKNMEDRILGLSNDLSANVDHIQQLSEVILSLKSAISDVNQTLAGMDNRILSLTETVDHLTSDVTNVKHVIKDEDLDVASALDNQATDTLVYKAPDYVVHAVIPGRAWLKTDSGQIITVTEGDTLGDYGKVALIDASNGLVRTSLGVVFK